MIFYPDRQRLDRLSIPDRIRKTDRRKPGRTESRKAEHRKDSDFRTGPGNRTALNSRPDRRQRRLSATSYPDRTDRNLSGRQDRPTANRTDETNQKRKSTATGPSATDRSEHRTKPQQEDNRRQHLDRRTGNRPERLDNGPDRRQTVGTSTGKADRQHFDRRTATDRYFLHWITIIGYERVSVFSLPPPLWPTLFLFLCRLHRK